jgi:DNA polymerase-3 subunit alpha
LVRLLVPLASGGEASILLGRDFALDAEVALRIDRIAGEGSTDLSAQEPPRLALVG